MFVLQVHSDGVRGSYLEDVRECGGYIWIGFGAIL